MAAGPRRHVAASGALIDTLLGPALLTPGVDAPSRGPRLPAHPPINQENYAQPEKNSLHIR